MENHPKKYRKRCYLHDVQVSVEKILKEAEDPNHVITEEYQYFKRLCVVLERIFKFELIDWFDNLFRGPSGYSKVLENLSKIQPEAQNSVTTVWHMSDIKTPDGRGRAWIALALMEKRLHVYLNAMCQNPGFLENYYSPETMWRSEETQPLLILITSLKDVNFNLFLKQADQSLRVKTTSTPFGFNVGKPIELRGSEIMAQCSNCFRHTKHLLLASADQKIYKCEACSKTTLPCKNKCGCMASNVRGGSGLCALCNNDILDWGPAYKPPENQADAITPPPKKPLVHLESTDEIIASIKKLESKEIPENLSSSPKKKKVKKVARTIQPEMSGDLGSTTESSEVVIRGKTIVVSGSSPPSSGISEATTPLSKSPPRPTHGNLKSSPPKTATIPPPDPSPVSQPPTKMNGHHPDPSEKVEVMAEFKKVDAPRVPDVAKVETTDPPLNRNKRDVEAELEEQASFDDLYKRYLTKNPGKIGSLSPSPSGVFDPKKMPAGNEKSSLSSKPIESDAPQPIIGFSKAVEAERKPEPAAEKEPVSIPNEGSSAAKNEEGEPKADQVAEVQGEAKEPSEDEEDQGGEAAEGDETELGLKRFDSRGEGRRAIEHLLNGDRHVPKAKSGSILSANLTPGHESTSSQSSRLKYLEDYFEVLPTDDEETAEIKRKLVVKMKNKRLLSSQQLSAKVEEPAQPSEQSKDYEESIKQMAEDLEQGARGQSMVEHSDESFEVTRDHWMQDERALKCSIAGCDVEFGFFNRRHHCRRCGDVICSAHSQHVLKLNRYALPDPKGIECKVCDECYENYRSQRWADEQRERQSLLSSINDSTSIVIVQRDDEQAMRGQVAEKTVMGQTEALDFLPAHFNQLHFEIFPKPAKVDPYCGDCGCTLPTGFLSSVRYCEATGRYFCVNCHTGKKAIIPGRVLENWDFSKYEVCDRAYSFLHTVYHEPSYSIEAIKPQLFDQVRPLAKVKAIKTQLEHLLNYLTTCSAPRTPKIQAIMRELHTFDPVKYSMNDLVRVEDGTLHTEYSDYTFELMQHVYECELCKAKGFICEVCRDPKPFYSFQIGIGAQCPECKTFFHKDCFAKVPKCPKCERIQKYKQRLQKSGE